MAHSWLIWFPWQSGELVAAGIVAGVMAGILGIGGGVLLVPLLITLGHTPVQSVATSSLAIVITSISGTLQNWRMGYFDIVRVMNLGIPALITAQLGAHLAAKIPPHVLLDLFGILLLLNIYLVTLREDLRRQEEANAEEAKTAENSPVPTVPKGRRFYPLLFRLFTGSLAGVLAGLFGIGGGVIMVPLQMLLLQERIKVAIQTSLAVIVGTAVSATIAHAAAGNVLFHKGILLGIGGLIGAQLSTRILLKLPDGIISYCFRAFLWVLALYMFWQSWRVFFQMA